MNKKSIRTIITLAEDTFEGGGKTLTAEGLRTSVIVRFGGGAIMPHAELVVYGLSMKTMLKLMRIRWQDMRSMMNIIRIEAGDHGKDLHRVFEGNITFAYIDTSNAPEIGLRVSAIAGILQAYQKAAPISYQGAKPVVDAISDICQKMEYEFENNGVSNALVMENVAFDETNLNKIRRICRDYQIDLYIDHNKIAIAPQGLPRNIKTPVLSPKSGMIGYPTPTIQGVDVRCLWSPDIQFGGLVKIKDSLMETTNGEWRIFGVTTHLESELPGGRWFSDIQATFKDVDNVAISRV